MLHLYIINLIHTSDKLQTIQNVPEAWLLVRGSH